MKVSVIMPVYNAAASLQRSLGSLKAQTFKDFELVAVDDCSADGSGEIVKAFAEENGIALKLIRHERNRGVAAARNTALEAAEGRFIAWLDADDEMAPEALQSLVESAEKNSWDVTGCEWYLVKSHSERYMVQAGFDTPEQALKNLMAGVMRWNLWLFLIRRESIGGIRFEEGMNMGEDMSFMCRLFMEISSAGLVKQGLYRYSQSDSSVSKVISESNVAQMSRNVDTVGKALAESKFKELAVPYLDFLKLNIKLPLLISDRKSDYRRWYSWWPEANGSAGADKALPARTRLLQQAAAHKCWCAVRIYNFLLNKIYYGIIYR